MWQVMLVEAWIMLRAALCLLAGHKYDLIDKLPIGTYVCSLV